MRKLHQTEERRGIRSVMWDDLTGTTTEEQSAFSELAPSFQQRGVKIAILARALWAQVGGFLWSQHRTAGPRLPKVGPVSRGLSFLVEAIPPHARIPSGPANSL